MESNQSAFVTDRIAFANACMNDAIKRKPDIEDKTKNRKVFTFRNAANDPICVQFVDILGLTPQDFKEHYISKFISVLSEISKSEGDKVKITPVEKAANGTDVIIQRMNPGIPFVSARSTIIQ